MTFCATSEGVRTPSIQATAPARFSGPCMHEASSWTMPSAFGSPPYPTLVSSGSSSQMFTPAIKASSTSFPSAIIPKASSTDVFGPPFLKRFPLADAMTTGLALPEVTMVGPWADVCATDAAANPAAAPVFTNSRRFTFRDIARILSAIDHGPLPDGLLDQPRHLVVDAFEVPL